MLLFSSEDSMLGRLRKGIHATVDATGDEYCFFSGQHLKNQAALVGLSILPVLANSAYVAGVVNRVGPVKPGDERYLRALKRLATARGVKVTDRVSPIGPHYDPAGNSINTSGIRNPGLIAHEFGHSVSLGPKDGRKGFRKLHGSMDSASRFNATSGRGLSGALSTFAVSPASQYLTDNDLLGLGAASSALSLPMLAEEANASRIGYNTLRRMGAPRVKALGAFKGLPTYLASAAATGLLPYFTRKMTNSYTPNR